MTTTLITGANKGLGYEAARRLLAAGHDVWIGARSVERGEQAAAELGARSVQLDVTSDASVAAAVETVGSLDVLVNNAGIFSGYEADPDADDVAHVFATNVFGAVRVFHAFLPLLRASTSGVVVNVTSGLGSITRAFEVERPNRPTTYAASKAALNMLSSQWALAFPELRINLAEPGYTATEFNGYQGTQTVEEGTDAIVRLATIGADGPTGAYLSRHGTVPW